MVRSSLVVGALLATACSRPSTPSSVPEAASSAKLAATVDASAAPLQDRWTKVAEPVACADLAGDGAGAIFVKGGGSPPLDLSVAHGGVALRVAALPSFTETCNLAVDATGFFVVNAGVTVPTGREGSVVQIDRATKAATVVHTAKESLRFVALDDNAIYAIQEEKKYGVVRIDKRTRKASMLAPLSAPASALAKVKNELLVSTCALVTGADAAHPKGCTISAIEIATGASRTIAKNVGPAYAFAVDGDVAYIPDATSGTVTSLAADGSMRIIARDLGAIRGLAFDDTRLYVVADRTLRAITKDGGPATTLATFEHPAQAIVLQGNDVYLLMHIRGANYELPANYETPMTGSGTYLARASKSALLADAKVH